jgi:transposase InsO family protein
VIPEQRLRLLHCGAGRGPDRHGKPGIFNTDQGSQFTSFAFTNTLREAGIRISMSSSRCGGRSNMNACS